MDSYKIINATEFDASLTLIAEALRTKFNDTTMSFTFPDGFISAINRLTYETENPETQPGE